MRGLSWKYPGAVCGLIMGAAMLCPTAEAGPSLVWAKKIGGPGPDQARSVAVDPTGNVYLAGTFSGTVDFDPGPGVSNLTSDGPTDIFVSKLNSAGKLVWARRIGGKADDTGYGVAVDRSGAVYVAGSAVNAKSNRDIIITKFGSSGSRIWTRRLGGNDDFCCDGVTGEAFWDEAYSIAVDDAGNVYSTGHFVGSADFDPGPANTTLTCNSTYSGVGCMFILKLDGAGNFVWAKTASEYGDSKGLDVIASGASVYVTGQYFYDLRFSLGCTVSEPGPENSANDGGFILQLDPDGNCEWIDNIDNIGTDPCGGCWGIISYDISRAIAVDSLGEVYATGEQWAFGGKKEASQFQAFVQKTGSWKTVFGDLYEDRSYDVAVDANGNIYTVGYSVDAENVADLILTKRDNAGVRLWSKKIGSGSPSHRATHGFSLALDSEANIFVTGEFVGEVDFALGSRSRKLVSTGDSPDAFILKIAQPTLTVGDTAQKR
jgi:hypothetical protein